VWSQELVISEETRLVISEETRLVISEETSVVTFGGGLVISEGTSVVVIGDVLVLSEGASVVRVVVDYDVGWSRGLCVGSVDQGNGPEEKH
jgi:hypothetical protein